MEDKKAICLLIILIPFVISQIIVGWRLACLRDKRNKPTEDREDK